MFGRIGSPSVETVSAATTVAVEDRETYELGCALMDPRASYPSANDTLLGFAAQGLYWVSQRYLEVSFLDANLARKARKAPFVRPSAI
jgi:hypothetical protein